MKQKRPHSPVPKERIDILTSEKMVDISNYTPNSFPMTSAVTLSPFASLPSPAGKQSNAFAPARQLAFSLSALG